MRKKVRIDSSYDVSLNSQLQEKKKNQNCESQNCLFHFFS